MSNNFKSSSFLRANLRGDGGDQNQSSLFLNLPKKTYAILYILFTICALETQFGPANFIFQAYLVVALVTIPGHAILQARVLDFGNQLLNFFFGVILSLISLMLIFVVIDLFFPAVGINHPLSPLIVNISANLLIGLSLYICAIKSRSDIAQLNVISKMFKSKDVLVGALLIIFAFFATLTQNSRHNSTYSVILFTIVFIIFILMLSLENIYENDSRVVLIFYFASLAIFIALIFRGETGFNGYDINAEYRVAQNVLEAHFWSNGLNDAYNAMLSITVLPVILSLVSKFSLLTIFKLFYILLAALIPGVLFIFFRKYANPQATIFSILIFIVGGASYFGNLTALSRQIVGLLLFIGIWIVLFESNWSFGRRQRFIFVLALGLSFSHYSTAYIFAGMALLSAIIYSIIYFSNFTENLSLGRKDMTFLLHRSRVLTIPFAIFIILITYSWNGVITQSSQNLQGVVKTLITQRNDLKLLPNRDQSLVLRYLAGNTSSSTLTLEEIKRASIIVQTRDFPTLSIRPESYDYQVKQIPTKSTERPLQNLSKFVNTSVGGAKLLSQAAVVFTIVVLFLIFLRARRLAQTEEVPYEESTDRNGLMNHLYRCFGKLNLSSHLYDLTFMTFVSFLLAVVARSSGLLGKFYNTDRLALQMAIIWCLPLSIMLSILIERFRVKRLATSLMIFSVSATLLFQLGFVTVWRGDLTNKINSKNWQSDSNSVTLEMFTTQQWISNKLSKNDFLQTDCVNNISFGKFNLKGALYRLSMPYNLDSGAFIYKGPGNLKNQTYFDCSFNVFKYPSEFIDKYYLPVYTSTNTEVLR